MELHTREALAPVFEDLNQYAVTMHFPGESTILTLCFAERLLYVDWLKERALS